MLSAATLGLFLETAKSDLEHKLGVKNVRFEIQVRLGMDYSRLGLMESDSTVQDKVATEPTEAQVKAWVATMWNVAPDTQEIRTRPVGQTGNLLVSAADKTAFDALTNFSHAGGHKFTHCKPANLVALDRLLHGQEQTQTAVLVLTEGAPLQTRQSIVQIALCSSSTVLALWRGWVPADVAIDTTDQALQSALHRFRCAHAAGDKTPTIWHHWAGQFDPSTPPLLSNASPVVYQ
jgi:hypothetical protein